MEEKLEEKKTEEQNDDKQKPGTLYETTHHGSFYCSFDENDNCPCLLCHSCEMAYESLSPPWMRLFHLAKYRAILSDIPFPSPQPMLSYVEPFEPDTFEFPIPSTNDIVQFFIEEVDGVVKPKLIYFSPYIQYYVFWAVTGGRICSNRNKQLFVLWNHKHKPIDIKSISQLQSPQNTHLWKTISNSSAPDFELFYKISETCQDVFDELLRIISNYDRRKTGSQIASVIHRNINSMPSFKTFRQDIKKDFEHKKYMWEYCQRKRGGNQGLEKPSNPTRYVLPCVHKMMVQYHAWLPNFRTRKKRQQTIFQQ